MSNNQKELILKKKVKMNEDTMNTDRTTQIIGNDAKQSFSDRDTEILDNRSTQILDDRSTQIIEDRTLDDRSTQIIEDKTFKEKNEDFKLKRTKIDAGDIIGSGYVIGNILSEDSGEADIHFCTKNDVTYVAKIYKKTHFVNDNLINKIKSITSPYILKPIEFGMMNERYFEIIPYYKNGTLFENINKLSLEFIKKTVVKEVNEGLKAIHDKDISHNDIKPHNIFITDDFNHIVIGDFGISKDLMGRTYVTKTNASMTLMYSAPEADESSSRMVDYYAFGMTLLHLAFKDDPFKGISNHKIRMILLNYSQNIPKEIDDDLADLISMLIKNAPYERLDYDGVNKWIENNKCYFGCRNENDKIIKNSETKINEYTFKIDGVSKKFYDLIELTKAMNDNWDEALKHYDNYLLNEAIKSSNQSLYLDLKEIYEKYDNNHDLGLFLTLHILNPYLNFSYKNTDYKNFKGFIEDLEINYPQYNEDLLNKDVLVTIARNEKLDQKIISTIQILFDSFNNQKDKLDMIINYFKTDEKFYYDGNVFSHLSEFSKYLFIEGKPRVITIEENKSLYYNIFIENYGIDRKIIDNISNIDDRFVRYCKFGKIINGFLPLSFKNHDIKNLYDFISLSNNAYENNDDETNQFVLDFILDGRLIEINKLEETDQSELLSLISNEKSDQGKLATLFYYTKKDGKYFGCSSVAEMIKKMSNDEDLSSTSSSLVTDEVFYIWLNSKGYKIN